MLSRPSFIIIVLSKLRACVVLLHREKLIIVSINNIQACEIDVCYQITSVKYIELE